MRPMTCRSRLTCRAHTMNRGDQRAAYLAADSAAAADHLVERRLDAPKIIWVVATLVVVALGFPYVAPLFY